MSTPTPEKPMRADALRSRERILEAAEELIAEEGLSTTLNEIARRAGVGVGTVYRHFPDREELIETLLQSRVDQFVAIGETGLEDPDPWHGLVTALERGLELQASDRGLRQLVHNSPDGFTRVARVRARVLPVITELVTRAQAADALHREIVPSDLPLVQLMLAAIMDASREVDPGLWRRYLGIVLRGIAAHPETTPPLRALDLDPEDVDRIMTAGSASLPR